MRPDLRSLASVFGPLFFVVCVAGPLCLALVRVPSVHAAEHENVLAFDDFLKQVLSAHPLISATEQEIESAKAVLLASEGAFDPVLKGEHSSYPTGDYSGTYSNLFVEQPLEWYGSKVVAGYRKGGGNFPIYEDYYATNDGGEARAGIEIPLLRDGVTDRRRASIARASKQIDVAGMSLTQRKVELARAASGVYWEWVAAREKLNTYRELLKTAQVRDKQLAERAESGDLARIDRIDNERQVLQRQSQLISAERALKKAEFDLGLFLWRADTNPADQTSRIEPDRLDARVPPRSPRPPALILPAEEEAISEALRTRVEHKRIENFLEQQEIEQELAQNQLLPRLDLATVAASDFGGGSDSRDEAELKTGVKLEIPLWTRTQRGRIAEITAKQRELSFQRKLTEQKIGVEVTDSMNAFTMALSRLDVASSEVAVARELEKAERMKFEQGESNLIFVNLREQQTADALIREIDAVADCWKGYIAYQAALGVLGV